MLRRCTTGAQVHDWRSLVGGFDRILLDSRDCFVSEYVEYRDRARARYREIVARVEPARIGSTLSSAQEMTAL